MKKFAFGLILASFLMSHLYAAPRQIILLRHADKLQQTATGPAVSAKGYIRALKFSYYILNQYGEPDFVIAGKPKGKDASIRELQTVGPLVNILAERHPESDYPILHPYEHKDFEKLSEYILNDKKFDDKLILICWRHTKIVELAKALGVKDHLEVWPDNDFDSVYIIEYNKSGSINHFKILHDQYPIQRNISWDDIYRTIISDPNMN